MMLCWISRFSGSARFYNMEELLYLLDALGR